MTLKEIIEGLKFTVNMFMTDLRTGETYAEPRNDMDKITVDACKGAIELLEQEPCEDCISRQAALGCCRNKWEEEVKIRLKSLPPVMPKLKYEDIAKAFQFGLAFGFGKKYDEIDRVIDEIKKVVAPQPKTGHWIEYGHRLNVKYYQCSICKGFDGDEKGKYCKWCGAKMVEPQENERVNDNNKNV